MIMNNEICETFYFWDMWEAHRETGDLFRHMNIFSYKRSYIILTISIENRMYRINPKGLFRQLQKSRDRIPKDTLCVPLILNIYVRVTTTYYTSVLSLWKDGRTSRVRPSFHLTSDKRPEGSQRGVPFPRKLVTGPEDRKKRGIWVGVSERCERISAPSAASCVVLKYRSSSLFTPSLNIAMPFSISHSVWILPREKYFRLVSSILLSINSCNIIRWNVTRSFD